MMLSVFGDAIVAILLMATISYAAVLNRRLGVLRRDRAKLEELVRNLATATQRAEAGVANLKAAAADTGRQLEKRVEQAQSLRDDLAYMIERGGTIADRLEGTIRGRREEPKSPKADKAERRGEPMFAQPAERKMEAIRRVMEARGGLRQSEGHKQAAEKVAAASGRPR
jgi:DNA repair exonuclease SbcCD ATPase subunit